jgi:uncharacterized protein YbbK (DUF523 family)
MGVGDEGWHVREEWSLEDPRLIALCPEMALEGLEVRRLDVSGDQVPDVSLEGAAVIAIVVGERIAVASKARLVPLLR